MNAYRRLMRFCTECFGGTRKLYVHGSLVARAYRIREWMIWAGRHTDRPHSNVYDRTKWFLLAMERERMCVLLIRTHLVAL